MLTMDAQIATPIVNIGLKGSYFAIRKSFFSAAPTNNKSARLPDGDQFAKK
jgi:hypothetical protein